MCVSRYTMTMARENYRYIDYLISLLTFRNRILHICVMYLFLVRSSVFYYQYALTGSIICFRTASEATEFYTQYFLL